MTKHFRNTAPAKRAYGLADFAEAVPNSLRRLGLSLHQEHLLRLWDMWDMVMGADLAEIALPLGHRDAVLIVGGEDHLVLQELTYAAPEMLERANAFMDQDFFQRIELQLLMSRTPLNRIQLEKYPVDPPASRPEPLGGLFGLLNPKSPIGRCYAAYVRMFEPDKK